MTEIPQVETILFTGSGGRLGRLLRAAAKRHASSGPRLIFQSRKAGTDVTWQPGLPVAPLPRCELIVALWGTTAGTEEELAENTRLVAVGAKLAAALGATRMVHLSSAAVYGPGHQMGESHPTGQTGAYGLAKLAMERAVAALPENERLRHICLRLGNVVGADSLGPALRGETPGKMDRFSDGNAPLRSYIGADQLLKVILGLARLPTNDWPAVLNVAAPNPVRMDSLLTAAAVPFEYVERRDSASQHATLDVTTLQRLLPDILFAGDADRMIADWHALETRS